MNMVEVRSWALIGVASAVVVVWLVAMVRAIVRIARRPTPDVESLRLREVAIGSLGRAIAVAAYVGLVVTFAALWQGGDIGPLLWALSGVAVVTPLALIALERRWPMPGGIVRTAALTRRRARDVWPRAGAAIAGASLAIMLLSMVLGGLSAPTADSSRSPGGSEPAVGPGWPTWSMTVPLLVGLVAASVVTWLAVRSLLRRPALTGFDSQTDLTYRRHAVDRVLRVLSAFSCAGAAMVVAQVARVAQAVPSTPPDGSDAISSFLQLQSISLLVAALISVELFRVQLPRLQRGRSAAESAARR